ncbi:MAG: glmZ(sRNA)-inactivating NTPase [Pelotomaculum sp. PtaB.Bin013]|uniref:RNase adapter RapZ n=1 Tax=Pelotomaculum isophthalicicum JI TaxID=947010 RepID=A0A9X4H7Y6_9FIRM|nr:RNase adapter RapZ [Pelotomaculum isophthalicicum]MDF9408179.1 RNase adapter RapZ [Pelotomaculum isophthalicicum JI]OPX82565.1 MAG: glmZ(sRNA)-inactivating NTPase [Pelotomaculum sp. PtaB.Bin013]
MVTQRLVIVTGLSGAGKTQALHSLEDLGFFCVDNLPPALIPKFAELCAQAANKINKIALVVDIRGGEFFDTFFEVLSDLDARGIRCEILFLEASNETLVRRFKESRRRHPLSTYGEVLEGIQEERSRLQDLRGRANKIIDTSNMAVQQLKEVINGIFADGASASGLHITVISFGFKYGIPLDSDLVFDVRFLPNPYYQNNLRPFTGNDAVVREYVFSSPLTSEFMGKFSDLVQFLIPQYSKEGKTTLMIAVGCTGGMHRSVALANRLGEILSEKNFRVTVRHRDINRSK